MIGSNEMRFNGATMIEIVQYYLDNKLLNKNESSPKVTKVGYLSTESLFFVDISSQAAE